MSCRTHGIPGTLPSAHVKEQTLPCPQKWWACLFSLTALEGVTRHFQLVMNVIIKKLSIKKKKKNSRIIRIISVLSYLLTHPAVTSKITLTTWYFGCRWVVALHVAICREVLSLCGFTCLNSRIRQEPHLSLAHALKAILVSRISCFYIHLFLSWATF